MMLPEPDFTLDSELSNWFPFDCPECRQVSWYLPNAEYELPLPCGHIPTGAELAKRKGESWLDRWWKVFFAAAHEQGRLKGRNEWMKEALDAPAAGEPKT